MLHRSARTYRQRMTLLPEADRHPVRNETPSSVGVTRIAVAAIVAGIVGALIAVGQVAVPPAVPPERFSYPLDGVPFAVVQVVLFLHHVVIAAVVLAVFHAGAAGSRRSGRVGATIGAAGLVLLGLQELVAILVGGETGDTALVGLVGTGYGLFSILLGVGLVLLGIAVVRARRWSGWRRGLPLVVGIYMFVPLTPSVLGPYWLGMLALGVWSLLCGALGAALLIERQAPRPVG